MKMSFEAYMKIREYAWNKVINPISVESAQKWGDIFFRLGDLSLGLTH